ncbi:MULTISPECIES: acyltransferase [unclassified Vibrio]|uniref:Acyltransferase family protein n=1 Tax=Vibrio sp. HB236076 TaxID=3232307 RepID=A0AB39HF72_9VIBR|nr:acyltransferase family protein [Vibrio sp. HB161653]MDP5255723.1 acyltransferase family protein [Vibrio sp. HB161653]
MSKRIEFFDLLRVVAAVVVVAIHVLGPYRHQFSSLPFDQWSFAVGLNSVIRWAVPVFLLITGALMLSDRRPFQFGYYLKRRVAKVVIPFVVWSIFYAFFASFTPQGQFNPAVVEHILANISEHAAYYHLGFFYYFIPLYLLAPFFKAAIERWGDEVAYGYVFIWLVTTALYLAHIDGPWSQQMWLYSGYLPLGYLLLNRMPNSSNWVLGVTAVGTLSLVTTAYMVIDQSVIEQQYTIGRWLSYKTLNVVLAASMVFVLGRWVCESLPPSSKQSVAFISRHSLGIYLAHPIVLWPMKQLGWYQGNTWLLIPLWTVIGFVGALAISYLLSKTRVTAWLVP